MATLTTIKIPFRQSGTSAVSDQEADDHFMDFLIGDKNICPPVEKQEDFFDNSLESLLKIMGVEPDEILFQSLMDFANKILSTAQDLSPRYIKVINKKFWDLF